jgi:hypothetical protein
MLENHPRILEGIFKSKCWRVNLSNYVSRLQTCTHYGIICLHGNSIAVCAYLFSNPWSHPTIHRVKYITQIQDIKLSSMTTVDELPNGFKTQLNPH